MRKVPLAAVAEVIRGVSFSKEVGDTIQSDGKLPVIRAGSIQDSLLLNEGQIWVPREKVKAHQKIRRDDIVMCTSSGSSDLVGKCAKSEVDFEGSFGAFCAGIRPIEGKVSASYLYHFLSSPSFRNWTRSSSGANIKNIRISELAEFEIPLPPLPEQKRIAAILDKADAIRRKRQQAIQLADDFLRVVFLDMFGDPVTNPKGWKIEKIDDLCDVQGGLQVSKKRAGLPVAAPYLRVANVLRNALNIDEIKTIGLTEAEFDRVRLKENDILIVEGHGNPNEIGRCALWTGEVDGMVHQNHLIRARVKSGVIRSQFVNDYINSPGGKIQMMRASNTTSGLNTISTGIVKSTKIIVPPVKLQDEYISIVDKVRFITLLQGLYQQKNSEIFFSLSQKAFNEKL